MNSAPHDTEPSERSGNHFDAIILGGGISGMVSAAILAQQNVKRLLLVDEYPTLGGNHLNFDFGPYTFDIGTFIFHDDSALFKHFPELLPLYVPVDSNTSRIRPDGKIAPYPFSIASEIFAAGPIAWIRIAASLAMARIRYKKQRNAEDFARYWIGDYLLTTSGLHSYMRRFYGVSPSEIELSFAKKRMKWVAEAASFRKRIKRVALRTPIWERNQSMVRPRAGFASLYRIAQETLAGKGVRFSLGTPVLSLKKNGEEFVLNIGTNSYTTPRLISTIPIDKALSLLGYNVLPQLPALNLTSLFFSFQGTRNFSRPILYNFGESGDWKRLTMFSDFYGPANGREYFTTETVGKGADSAVTALATSVIQHLNQMKVLRGDIRLEGFHSQGQAYPVYTHGVTDLLAEKINILERLGIESFGRQGGFDYLPTAKATTLVAEAALRESQ